MNGPSFSVGSRIAFNNSVAFMADWEFGTVTDARNHGLGFQYRIEWDDGFVDPGEDAWYGESEIVPEASAFTSDRAPAVAPDSARGSAGAAATPETNATERSS